MPRYRGLQLHGWRRLAADVKWCAARHRGIGTLRATLLSVNGTDADALNE